MYRYLLVLIYFVICNSAYAATVTEASKDADYLAGQILNSPNHSYTIVKKLGEGAFGCVYLAEDETGVSYAIKTYKDNHPEHGILEDPVREFHRGQILNHPHILKSIELFTTQKADQKETSHLVLEFFAGEILHKTDRGYLKIDESVQAVGEFLDAIKSALSYGYMHFDLHPGNIMLDENGKLMVIDLGSFFDKEEIFKYILGHYLERQNTVLPTTKRTRMVTANPVSVAEIQCRIKNEKLDHFFSKNPKLLDELITQCVREMHKTEVPNIHRRLFAIGDQEPVAFRWVNNSMESKLMSTIYTTYLNHVGDICLEVLRKSNRDRAEKIALFVELKKIYWNYQEDIYEKIETPFEIYIDEMREVLSLTPS